MSNPPLTSSSRRSHDPRTLKKPSSTVHISMTETQKTTSTATSVKSAARFADILEFVADAVEAPTFAEISIGLDVPKSSLFHLLSTLVNRGYLLQNESRGGGYQLGPSITKLASRMSKPASYAAKAQPAIKLLAELINETSGYYEKNGDEAEALRAESAKHQLVYTLTTGDRAPLYCISAGKILLANLPTEEIHAYLKRTNPKKFTPHTQTTAREILKELKKVRETGFAYSLEEYSLGIIGIATAVTINGQVVGALSVALPSVRHNTEIDGRIRRALTQAASMIERSS